MLYLDYENPFDQLRKFALYIDADFKEHQDSAVLEFDNNFGKGKITTYHIFKGLTVRVYDVTFAEDFKMSKKEFSKSTIYFLYCVHGYFLHKFEEDEEYKNIAEKQNVILSSITNIDNEVIMPANVHLRMTAIFLKDDISSYKKKQKTVLESVMEDVSTFIKKDVPSGFFGDISPLTATYAKILLENKRKDAVGKLLIKAAVINTLASQIESYDKSLENSKNTFPLNDSEILKMAEIADYISSHLSDNITIPGLSKKYGLSPRKLQLGSRYIFGESLGNLITNLRMEKSMRLLQKTDLTISEISYQIGISSRSYFSKAFSEKYGMLPSKFKESLISDNLVFEITYKSTMKDGVDTEEIERITQTSIENNKKNKITGCLVCQDNSFFQLLEGSKSQVLETFEKIKQDSRHFDVIELTRRINTERIFPDWNLALLSSNSSFSQEFQDKAINLDIQWDTLLNSSAGKSNEVFWRKVLNVIKIKQKA